MNIKKFTWLLFIFFMGKWIIYDSVAVRFFGRISRWDKTIIIIYTNKNLIAIIICINTYANYP